MRVGHTSLPSVQSSGEHDEGVCWVMVSRTKYILVIIVLKQSNEGEQ